MQFKTHVVQPGDTLTAIVEKYYGSFSIKTLDMVMQHNRLDNPNRISVGQSLRLPGNWGGKSPADGVEMVVAIPNSESISKLLEKSAPSETPRVGGDGSFVSTPLSKSDYWQEKYHKDLIVLHFTAGYNARSAMATFAKPGRVATPFVVDVDGKIYKLFDEKYWGYHLGIKGAYGENNYHDKRSIGIEIVNIGPVWNKGGVWKDYVGKTWPSESVVVGKDRGADGGVAFPRIQMDAVFSLINYLCAKYGIPRQVPKDFMAFQLPALRRFRGIVSHQNFRSDKYDMGVAFTKEWYHPMVESCALVIK